MLINLQEIKDFVSISAVADYLGLQCAAEVYPNIVDELYCCIVIGMSYDKMNKKKFVALDRKDFYAYRKKTLAVFREALKACNRYPF